VKVSIFILFIWTPGKPAIFQTTPTDNSHGSFFLNHF
jgi:hypothetical protein